jgi:hypothetical protein
VLVRTCRRGLLGTGQFGGDLKKAENTARNRTTLQEKAQNLNEPLLLPVYING